MGNTVSHMVLLKKSLQLLNHYYLFFMVIYVLDSHRLYIFTHTLINTKAVDSFVAINTKGNINNQLYLVYNQLLISAARRNCCRINITICSSRKHSVLTVYKKYYVPGHRKYISYIANNIAACSIDQLIKVTL